MKCYPPLAEALREEGRHGAPIVAAEGAAGAKRFVEGAGRGGKFGVWGDRSVTPVQIRSATKR